MFLKTSVYWSLDHEPLSLGTLLILRQEIELLAQKNKIFQADLFFGTKATLSAPLYLQAALTSTVNIRTAFLSEPLAQNKHWPAREKDLKKWPYSSFKRVDWLLKNYSLEVGLQWPALTRQVALDLYNKFSENGSRKVIAIHMKNQSSLAEESNANLVQWELFLKKNSDTIFFLLGHDTIPSSIRQLPHVISADYLNIPLQTQLAFCEYADGFLGMASGICAGAIFSKTPYVIFKHPKHHSLEMEEEIGRDDKLPFGLSHQKLWRMTDDLDSLNAAGKIIGLI